MVDRYCCIKECFNSRLTAKGLSFFRFPSNRERCMQWMVNCNRQDLFHKTNVHSSQYLVCATHFEVDCFADPHKRNLLLKSAVPTLFTNTLGGTKLPSRFKGKTALASKTHKKGKTEHASKIHKKGNEENEYGVYYEVEVENNTNTGIISKCTNEYFTRLSQNVDHCEDLTASKNYSNKNHHDRCLPTSNGGDYAFSSEHFMAREIDLTKLPKCWAVSCNPSEMVVFKMRQETVIISVKITGDGGFSLKVLNSDLANNHPILHYTPVVTFPELLNLLNKIDEWTVCSGNSHKHFLDLLYQITNTKDCRIIPQTMSLHSTNCYLLFPPEKETTICAVCKDFLAELRKEYL